MGKKLSEDYFAWRQVERDAELICELRDIIKDLRSQISELKASARFPFEPGSLRYVEDGPKASSEQMRLVGLDERLAVLEKQMGFVDRTIASLNDEQRNIFVRLGLLEAK